MARTVSAASTTAAPTHNTKVAHAGSTAIAAGNHVQLLAAPPTHKREGCALNMVQEASAMSATVAPTHERKVAVVQGTT